MKVTIEFDGRFARVAERLRAPRWLAALAFAGSLGAALVVSAAPGDAVPHVFSAGQPIRAVEVNANFAELSTQIGTVNAALPTRARLYERVASASIDPNTAGTVSATCRDANDLLLHGACSGVDVHTRVYREAVENVDAPGSALGYGCTFQHQNAAETEVRSITSRVLCLEVDE